jgi:hypothetical protein
MPLPLPLSNPKTQQQKTMPTVADSLAGLLPAGVTPEQAMFQMANPHLATNMISLIQGGDKAM